MELSEIYNRLSQLGIPVTYNKCRENPTAPYVVYYETNGRNYGGDNINLIRVRNVRIDLYSKDKNSELEKQLEALFNDTELTVSESWNEMFDLICVSYSFESITRIKRK